MNWRKWIVWVGVGFLAAALVTLFVVRNQHWRPRTTSIQGAVVRKDTDPRKELPISNATVTATDGLMTVQTHSDASGYFHLKFRLNVWPGQAITLSFRHPDYETYDMTLHPGIRANVQRLYIAELTSLRSETPPPVNQTSSLVDNIRIRYTVNSQAVTNIGSVARTFQVVNKGDVPCNRQAPCSPDGRWKAATGSLTMDAGPDDEYREVRVSCMAGPCPFTRIDSDGYSQGGRVIKATALNWSGTTTFLLEAEVFRTAMTSIVRESYPVIFGQALNFTLPPAAEGVSIEADLNGTSMVFPLGPDLYLSWATCTARTSREGEHATAYRCELKPGFRLKDS